MAASKCPACPSTDFELVNVRVPIRPDEGAPARIVTGAPYGRPLVFVQCKSCGAVVGAFDTEAWQATYRLSKLLGKDVSQPHG